MLRHTQNTHMLFSFAFAEVQIVYLLKSHLKLISCARQLEVPYIQSNIATLARMTFCDLLPVQARARAPSMLVSLYVGALLVLGCHAQIAHVVSQPGSYIDSYIQTIGRN